MKPLQTDREGKRKAPRAPGWNRKPKANIRASYRLGITLIERLEAIERTVSQWFKDGATMWPRQHRQITTSDIARNLIKYALDQLITETNKTDKSMLERIVELIQDEEPDYEEEDRELDYGHTKKYGAAGIKQPRKG